MAAVYTHGHHESVLRSHRWRTAENSAAYLLPHLKSGAPCWTSAAVPAPSPPISRRWSHPAGSPPWRSPSGARPGPRRDRPARAGHGRLRRRRRARARLPRRHLRRRARPPGAAARGRPGGRAARDAPGDPAGRRRRGTRQRLRRVHLVPQLPELDEWLALYRAVARGNGGEPDAGRRLLSWAHAAGFTDVTATSSTWCFATPEDRPGGAACGPTGSSSPTWRAWHRRREERGPAAHLRRPGRPGRPTRTAGCPCCTAS
jgi:hypothetical protein